MKKIVFLISLLFLFNMFSVLSLAESTDPPIVEPDPTQTPDNSTGSSGRDRFAIIDDGTPTLKLASDSMITLSANSSQVLEITIQNASSYYANNIVVQAAVSGSDIPFKMEFLEKSNVRNSLQNGVSMKLKLKIDVDKNATQATYPVQLSYTYVNSSKASFTGSDTILIRIESDLRPPTIVLQDIKSGKEKIKSGDTTAISAAIENIGDQDAFDLRVSLEGLDSKTVSLAGGVNTIYYKEYMQGFKNDIRYDLIAHKNTPTGSYPITFKITYKNKKGESFEQAYQYFLVVTNESTVDNSEKADIMIINSSASADTIEVGDQFEVFLDLQNTGISNAKNIKIAAIPVENGEIVPKTASIQQINSMAPGETKRLVFGFSPTSKSKSQNYAIGFTVDYETGIVNDEEKAEIATFNQYVGVNVLNKDADKKDSGENEKKSEPKIIISKYETNPVIVEAGKKFDLFMTFKNSHSTKSVENIKLYITVDEKTEEKGNVFSPDNSSNTFYIDSIPPKGEISHTFKMFTVPDALARTYTIIVKFEYEDAEGTQISTSELVGINVKQVSKLENSEIVIPPEGFVGQPVPVSFQIYNTGEVTLRNLMIKIDGNFDVSSSNMFYGNFESGYNEYYESVFIPTTTGMQTGRILISYDDTDGEHIEKSEEFNINIMEPIPYEEEFPIDGDIEKENLPFLTKIMNLLKNKFFFTAIIVLAVASSCAVVFIRKKIKKKKGLDFYE